MSGRGGQGCQEVERFGGECSPGTVTARRIRPQNPDNPTRNNAESQCNHAISQPRLFLEALSSLVSTPRAAPVIRSTSAILLQRYCPELWERAKPDIKTSVESRLFVGISSSGSLSVSRKLDDTMEG